MKSPHNARKISFFEFLWVVGMRTQWHSNVGNVIHVKVRGVSVKCFMQRWRSERWCKIKVRGVGVEFPALWGRKRQIRWIRTLSQGTSVKILWWGCQNRWWMTGCVISDLMFCLYISCASTFCVEVFGTVGACEGPLRCPRTNFLSSTVGVVYCISILYYQKRMSI